MQEKKFMPYKFIFKNAYIPIWMGFGGILIECLLIVLYGLVPVFLPSGYTWRRIDTARGTLWHKTFFLNANISIQILHKNARKKNVPFKN